MTRTFIILLLFMTVNLMQRCPRLSGLGAGVKVQVTYSAPGQVVVTCYAPIFRTRAGHMRCRQKQAPAQRGAPEQEGRLGDEAARGP
jgi:hypothetical protein